MRGLAELADLDNGQLAHVLTYGHVHYSRERLLAEVLRVRGVQRANVLTGTDLGYWYERERLLQTELAR